MTKAERVNLILSLQFILLFIGVAGAENMTTINKLHVLGLFPLTGQYAERGANQMMAMQAAINATLNGSRTINGWALEITILNTKCDYREERRVVIKTLIAEGDHSFIIGGGCDDVTSDGPQSSSFISAAGVPQITFEPKASASDESDSYINVAPSIGTTMEAMVHFIKHFGWKDVILLSSSSDLNYKQSRYLIREMSSAGIKVLFDVDIAVAGFNTVLTQSAVRIVITWLSEPGLMSLLCNNKTRLESGRHKLLISSNSHVNIEKLRECVTESTAFLFSLQSLDTAASATQNISHFSERLNSKIVNLTPNQALEIGYAFDATKLMLDNLPAYKGHVHLSSPLKHVDQINKLQLYQGLTGHIQFNPRGQRIANVTIYQIQDNAILEVGFYSATLNITIEIDHPDRLSHGTKLQGISLPAFIAMTSISCLGLVYAVAILVFNIVKHNDRLIKLTSPYINVVIALGAILAYVSVGVFGMEYFLSTSYQVARLRQAFTFILTISFTLIYGSVLAKTWRVFMVFKNMQFNGKTTKDEHLLLGVVAIVVVDVVVLMCWMFADPILCSDRNLTTSYESTKVLLVTYQSKTCHSQNDILWVLLIFCMKSAILTAMVYCAWQARHVTLPSLKESQQIYASTALTISMSIVLVVLVVVNGTSANSLFIISSTCIITTTTGTLSWLFIPKISLARKHSAKTRDDPVKFLFSESMKKTRAKTKPGTFNCFQKQLPECRYVHDLVVSEIDNLKLAVKQKDATIRELTDRLFYGKEKFQDYLRTPRKAAQLETNVHYRKQLMRSRDSVRSNEIDSFYINSKNSSSLRTVTELIDGPNEIVDISQKISREMSRASASSDESDDDIVMNQRWHPGKEHEANPPTYVEEYSHYGLTSAVSKFSQDNESMSVEPGQKACSKDLMLAYMNSLKSAKIDRSISPNHDSAIENLSPSSDNNSEAFTEYGRSALENVQVSVSDYGDVINELDRSHFSKPHSARSLQSLNSYGQVNDVFRPIPRHPCVGFDSCLDHVAVTEV